MGQQLDEPENMCERQIASADVILLNKVDLSTPIRLAEVESRVKNINPTAVQHKTTRSVIELDALFKIRAFSARSYNHLPDPHLDSHHDHKHSNIRTLAIALPSLTPDQMERFSSFLESVLWDKSLPSDLPVPEILRIKGYFVRDDGSEYVLQGVMDLFEVKELPRQGVGPDLKGGKVVIIGKGLGEEFKAALRKFVGI